MSARLFASVPPEVKTISRASAWSRAASRSWASSRRRPGRPPVAVGRARVAERARSGTAASRRGPRGGAGSSRRGRGRSAWPRSYTRRPAPDPGMPPRTRRRSSMPGLGRWPMGRARRRPSSSGAARPRTRTPRHTGDHRHVRALQHPRHRRLRRVHRRARAPRRQRRTPSSAACSAGPAPSTAPSASRRMTVPPLPLRSTGRLTSSGRCGTIQPCRTAPDDRPVVHRRDAEGRMQVGPDWETLIERQIREAMRGGQVRRPALPGPSRCRTTTTPTPEPGASRSTCSSPSASPRRGSRPTRRFAGSSSAATRSWRARPRGRRPRRHGNATGPRSKRW